MREHLPRPPLHPVVSMADPSSSSSTRAIPSAAPRRATVGLRAIAVLKLLSGLVLAGVGLGALRLLDPMLAADFNDWLRSLALAADARAVQHAVSVVTGLDAHGLRNIAVAALAYAALLLTEGAGLWLERRWAEYLTVAVTASLLPFEGYALSQRLTAVRVLTLFVNVAIVGYLVTELRSRPARASRLPGSQR
jgi:uncharacterized membrane protein (DUF2068 family)